MADELTIPPCSYCGAPTEPVRQKKLNSCSNFYCSKPCEDKYKLLDEYKKTLDINHSETLNTLKVGIDMLYLGNLLQSNGCVFFFTNSLYSFKIDPEVKSAYSNLLQSKGEEYIRTVLSSSGKGRTLVRKV